MKMLETGEVQKEAKRPDFNQRVMRIKIHAEHNTSLLLVFGTLILLLVVSSAEAQTRSLTRSEDYVIFTGADVSSLIGCEVSELALYVYGRSEFRAVPFQVDKRDAEGRFVFPNETMRDPGRDGTRLDSNDEMVFMVKDAGDRRPDDAWVEAAVRGVEMELVDLDGGLAWIYLFYRPGADPPQTDDYVKYRVEGGKEFISSDQYETSKSVGIVSYDYLRLRRPDGSWGKDLFEEQKIVMRATLLQGMIPIYAPEQEVKIRVIGLIDGPVRVIRDELKFINVKAMAWEMINESFPVYYGNGHLSPMKADFPFTISKLFLDINVYWGYSFTEAVLGSTYWNPANPQGILLDGKPDPGMDESSNAEYMVISGPEGSMIEIIDLGDLKKYQMILTTIVHESSEDDKFPVKHNGVIMAGLCFQNSKRIPRGTHRYCHYHFYPYPYSESKVKEVLYMLEHPVEIKVRPIYPPLLP